MLFNKNHFFPVPLKNHKFSIVVYFSHPLKSPPVIKYVVLLQNISRINETAIYLNLLKR